MKAPPATNVEPPGIAPTADIPGTVDPVASAPGPGPLRFFVRALMWFAVLAGVWSIVGKWTTHPAAVISHMALEAGAGQWVRKVNKAPGMIEAETRLTVTVAPTGNTASAKTVRGEFSVEVNPQHYAYGLPLCLALLLAAGGPGRLWRAAAGYALLLPLQAFSITFDLLKQMAMTTGNLAHLGVAQWQVEAIVLGYQFGTLMLPTLGPVVVWLWLDQSFLARLVRVGGVRTAPQTVA